MISPAGTADGLKASADFFTATQQALRAATTTADLEVAAKAMDGAEFMALPPAARDDLAALYTEKFFKITGGLAG